MLVHLITRAYFDVFGNFTNVGELAWYPKLISMAKASGVSVEDLCYALVGGRVEERWDTAELSAFGKKKLKPKGGSLKFNKSDLAEAVNPEVRDVVSTLTNFIEHTTMAAMVVQGRVIQLHEVVSGLKLAQNAEALEEVLPRCDPLLRSLVRHAKVDRSVEFSYACGGEIRLKYDLDEDLLVRELGRNIGRRSLYMPPEHFYGLVSRVPFYHFAEDDSYRDMVDLAMVYDTTISELVTFTGFKYVKQFEIYARTGWFIYDLRNGKFLVVDPVDPVIYKEVERAELPSIFSRRGRWGDA